MQQLEAVVVASSKANKSNTLTATPCNMKVRLFKENEDAIIFAAQNSQKHENYTLKRKYLKEPESYEERATVFQ